MQYKKIVSGGYVAAAGDFWNGDPITREEYMAIVEVFETRPSAPSGYTYKLRADTLEWELVELPPMPEPEDEPTVEAKAEAYDILMGVIS